MDMAWLYFKIVAIRLAMIIMLPLFIISIPIGMILWALLTISEKALNIANSVWADVFKALTGDK